MTVPAPAAPHGAQSDADALIETNDGILDQIRTALSQEYVRFMSRMLKERLERRGSSSIFDHPDKPLV